MKKRSRFIKEKRHEIYKLALWRLNQKLNTCCCDAIGNAVVSLGYKKDQNNSELVWDNFPEMMQFQPKWAVGDYWSFWWEESDKHLRIEALELCIKQTA